MLDVLVTMRFEERQLDRLREVSPRLRVTRADPERADYARTDILYAGAPPRELSRAPGLKWVQLHMAGVDALRDHPLYAETRIPLTTTSGVHAAAVAEYAITVLLALAHRVPRMVEWRAKGGWPADEQRWLDYLHHPQVVAIGAVTWVEQPGVGTVPVPDLPGLPPLRPGTTAPSLDQHRKEILAEFDAG